jgi:hypothetical protein
MGRYVRSVFEMTLPNESVLRDWAAKLDNSPGFTDKSLNKMEKRLQVEKARVPVVLKVRFSVELNKWKKFSNISRKSELFD